MSPRSSTTVASPAEAGERGAAASGPESPPAADAERVVVPLGPIPDALWEALARAADAVHRAPSAIEHGAQPDDLRFQLDALCAAVRQAAAGADLILERAAPAVPVQRVLQRLGGAVLAEVSALGDTVALAEVLALLRAIERVHLALDRDEAHRFASRLSGAGGLELLVEVAHDLRSPLASITFLAETLRKGQSGALNAVQERQLGLVYSAAFGLSAMASDVIELARGGDRLVDLHPVPFSISDIMRSVCDIVQPMAEEKGLAIQVVLPEADFRVGHPGALNRVLLNLITNALKFTAEGHVELAARQLSRTRVEFSIEDTGRGIPSEVMDVLFETFRRRRKAGEYTFSSAGLGLSICRKLVAAMGSELRVKTAIGEGTRFHFELELPVASRL